MQLNESNKVKGHIYNIVMHEPVKPYYVMYSEKLISQTFFNYMALELSSDLLLRQSSKLDMCNALLLTTTAANDRLMGNKRRPRYTNNYPPTLPEHNALVSTHMNVYTGKRPGQLRQRNALVTSYMNVCTDKRPGLQPSRQDERNNVTLTHEVHYRHYYLDTADDIRPKQADVRQARHDHTKQVTTNLRPTVRYSKQTRLISKPYHNCTKPRESRTKNCRRSCVSHNHHVIMVISTHADSAVIRPIKLDIVKLNITNLSRHFKKYRSITKGFREPRRPLESQRNIEMTYPGDTITEGNKIFNYHTVVISTRAVFSVIMVIKHMVLLCDPASQRPFTVERSIARRSTRRSHTRGKLRVTQERGTYSPKTRDNYLLNYANVVISTRDVFAVNKPAAGYNEENVSQEDNMTLLFRLYISKEGDDADGDNYEPRGEKSKVAYQILGIKSSEKSNFELTNFKTNNPYKQRRLMTSITIWLLKYIGIVATTHSNKKRLHSSNYRTKYDNYKLLVLCDRYQRAEKNSSYQRRLNKICVTHKEQTLRQDIKTRVSWHHKLTRTLMVCPFGKENLRLPQHKIITITVDIKVKICGETVIMESSLGETQQAVEHIPSLSENSAEERVLDDFIMSQDQQQAAQLTPQYEYDPINDCMKIVTSTSRSTASGIGEKKQTNTTSIGKPLLCKANFNENRILYYPLSAGTEPIADVQMPSTPTTSTPHADNNVQVHLTATANDNTTDLRKETQPGSSRPNETSSSDSDSESSTASSSTAQSRSSTSTDTETSCKFSDDEEDTQPKKGQDDDMLAMYQRLDARIKAQKDAKWKVKKGVRVEDPRPNALIPIHAPKMERLSRLKALEQRALNAKAAKNDMVDEIKYGMDKANEIRYSMVAVGAEIITEGEILTRHGQQVIMASNDPNTVRPKPPQVKQSRDKSVLPFPQRRRQAIAREREARARTSTLSEIESDASWPTDQDDAIPRFSSKPKQYTRKVGQTTKTTNKKKPTNAVDRPRKLTKVTIAQMVQDLQAPVPISSAISSDATTSKSLKADEVKKLVQAEQARIRQRRYRAKKALSKKTEESEPKRDVLAHVIDISNILNSDTNEQEIEADSGLHTGEDEARKSYTLPDDDAPVPETTKPSSSDNDSEDCALSETSDEGWGSSRQTVRNPFASNPQTDAATGPTNHINSEHAGYFTQDGLEQQRRLHEAIKRRAGLEFSPELRVKLRREDVENYSSKVKPPCNSSSNNDNMSAKNISKDRSSSRGRQDGTKKDRFTKNREQGQPEDEKMDDEPTPGPSAGNQEQDKGNGKRQREPPRTGNHDNTTTEDSDDELPNAKRATPSLREKLTQVYQRKTKETRSKRDGEKATPSVELRIDASHAGEKVKSAAVPLLAPTTLAEAPTLSLKDIVPEQDQQDLDGQGEEEKFKTDRIEFVVVERELDAEEDSSKTDRDYEWEIPDRSTFDAVISQAIEKFTEVDWDKIDYVSFSSVGWNTGVGLFAFGSDKLPQMTEFREMIRSIKIGNKRFESYPKRMLLNRYALTIYFNAAFAFNQAPKLLFFFKKLNGFEGDLTIVETRFYPDDHPTRKGCKIVACEADQRFLDELYKYPKDHPFNIRYGGNIYVRGGERIDPDDPDAVRPRRPKLTRTAAKKFIHGAGEDTLNSGQRADDEAAKRAQDEHMQKHVGVTLPSGRAGDGWGSRVREAVLCSLGGPCDTKFLNRVKESEKEKEKLVYDDRQVNFGRGLIVQITMIFKVKGCKSKYLCNYGNVNSTGNRSINLPMTVATTINVSKLINVHVSYNLHLKKSSNWFLLRRTEYKGRRGFSLAEYRAVLRINQGEGQLSMRMFRGTQFIWLVKKSYVDNKVKHMEIRQGQNWTVRAIFKHNYVDNYLIMVISTRGDYAVIIVITEGKVTFICKIYVRGQAAYISARAMVPTLGKNNERRSFHLTPAYINYLKCILKEISTRDVIAVIKVIKTIKSYLSLTLNACRKLRRDLIKWPVEFKCLIAEKRRGLTTKQRKTVNTGEKEYITRNGRTNTIRMIHHTKKGRSLEAVLIYSRNTHRSKIGQHKIR